MTPISRRYNPYEAAAVRKYESETGTANALHASQHKTRPFVTVVEIADNAVMQLDTYSFEELDAWLPSNEPDR